MARRPIECPAGEWTTLVSNFGSGYPRTFEVELTTTDGSAVAGDFEVRAALWIFPQSPTRGALEPRMSFHRKWINAIYRIRIRPVAPVTARVR